MADNQSMELNNDKVPAARYSLNEIENILSKESVKKMAVQSQEKFMNKMIKEIQNNAVFQSKLKTMQNSCRLDHGCLQQLDYIFERSMVSISTKVQVKLLLENKVSMKSDNISNMSKDFLDQFNKMLIKYTLLHERKVSKSGLQQNIEKKKEILQSGNVLLKSCVQKMLTKKKDIGEIYNDSKKKEQMLIIKFAELMHLRDKERKQKIQFTKNLKNMKTLEGKIKELQITEIAKPKQNSNPGITFSSDIGIGKILALANLQGVSKSTVKLNAKESQCSESYSVALTGGGARKDMKYSKEACRSDATAPLLKQTKSRNLIASTSKYFKSSQIRLKTIGHRKSSSKVTSFENYNNVSFKSNSMTDLKLSKSKEMDKKINKELKQVNCSKMPEKRVQFSSEIKESYFNDEIKNYTNTTKIDVINIVRKDIIRSSVHSKINAPESLPKANNEKIQKIGELMEVEENGTNFNYPYSSFTQYFGANDDTEHNDGSGSDDSNDNSKDNIIPSPPLDSIFNI